VAEAPHKKRAAAGIRHPGGGPLGGSPLQGKQRGGNEEGKKPAATRAQNLVLLYFQLIFLQLEKGKQLPVH
jgi:hypothetical protein